MARAPDEMDPRPTRVAPAPERSPAPARRSAPDSDGDSGATAKGAPAPAQRQRRRAPKPVPPPRRERRVRQTIHKIDLWSVLKLSLCFYLCGLAVTLVALVALWLIADAFGIVGNVEQFIGDLLSSDDFTFLSGEMLRGVALVGLVVVMLQVVITVIAAAFYNLFAELFGGVEITVIEEEPIPRA